MPFKIKKSIREKIDELEAEHIPTLDEIKRQNTELKKEEKDFKKKLGKK